MYHEFLANILDVLFLCALVIWMNLSLNKKYSPYFLGVMFGLITIFVMNGKITVVEGRFFDFRHITLTLAGFLGGPVTAAITALISSLYRYHMGGSGYMGGVAGIIAFACFGTFLGKNVKSNQNGRKILFWFLIGIVMACISLFVIVCIPPWKGGTAQTLQLVSAPCLLITPIATTIIFNFYFRTYEVFNKASILNTILNFSPINLMIYNPHGPVVLSENLKMLHKSSQKFEELLQVTDAELTNLNTTKQLQKKITIEDERHFTADYSGFKMPSGEDAYITIVNDVTHRIRQQENLRREAEQLTKLLELEAKLSKSNQLIADIITHMPYAFYVLDNQWRFMFVNEKAEELFSRTRDELLGNILWGIYPQTKGSLCDQNFQKAMNNNVPVTFEACCPLTDNRWNHVTAYPSEFGLSIYYKDISEQKTAQNNLIKSQNEISMILESMTDCFFALDRDLKFTYVNRAGEQAFEKSRTELLGKKVTEVYRVSDTTLFNYQKVLNEKISVAFEVFSEALDGKWLEVSAYPTEIGLTCYFRDITSRIIAQVEMARLDRLNLVGQLAAGIGHEIRNPMTTVRGYLQLLGTKTEYAHQKPTFDLMISELDRANFIITEFLSLARSKQSDLKVQNLNDILNNLYPLLEADTFNQNKQIRFLPNIIPDLKLNEKEISQLILNLTRNGLEAMEAGGCLTIESYLKDGKVVLAIEDEGCGISPDNIKKLGTPFFTTKDYGTGLGLAISYKIAESHHAKITVDTNTGGTAFYISFPFPDDAHERTNMIA